jgi:S-adenosylmethionine hydrolase
VTRVITLLTDFGLSDTYVAQMKGVILAINPQAVVVDLTHEVRPQAVRQGAFLLETAVGAFPPDTVHVAVVDPGVGTARRALAVRAGDRWFVGPDNGLLSAALPPTARPAPAEAAGGGAVPPVPVLLPEGIRAVELRNPRLRREPVSATFHGRDVFAPAAAHLTRGVGLDQFGPAVATLLAFPPFRARPGPDGRIHGRVVSIDRFGNVITDVRAEDLPDRIVAWCRGREVRGPVRTYAEARGIAAVVGSAGLLEIAAPGGSAAALLGVALDEEVLVVPARDGA